MKPSLKELLLASFEFEDYSPLYTKVLLLNALLFSAVVINIVFILIHLFFTHDFSVMAVNVSIALLSLVSLYLLRERHDHVSAGYLGTVVLFAGFIVVTVMLEGANYTLIWSYFFAPFAMITLGASRGLVITLLFLAIILSVSYMGIGSWMQGEWNLQSYLRFLVAHILMVYIIYAVQNSNERANRKIEALRSKEQEQLKLFETLSVTDPLTGLYNRRFLEELFPRQLNSARRHNKVFAFFLLDMDYFKQFNDSYGHQKGDWALEQVSEVLKSSLRRSEDYAFRMGGEEFAGIVIGDDRNSVETRIASVVEAMRACGIENSGSNTGTLLTCSIGAYVVEDEDDFNAIYRKADEALYKAKADGRDQVVYVPL